MTATARARLLGAVVAVALVWSVADRGPLRTERLVAAGWLPAARPDPSVQARTRASLTTAAAGLGQPIDPSLARALDALARTYGAHPVLAETFETPDGLDVGALVLWSISGANPERYPLVAHRAPLRAFARALGVFPTHPDVWGDLVLACDRAGIDVNGPGLMTAAQALLADSEALARLGARSWEDPVPAAPALAWVLTADDAGPAEPFRSYLDDVLLRLDAPSITPRPD